MRLQKCLTFCFTSYVGWIFISSGGSKPPPYNDKINANIKIPLLGTYRKAVLYSNQKGREILVLFAHFLACKV